MDSIDFRTEHRLSDTMALQAFVLRHHLMRRALLLALFMLAGLVVTTMLNGAPMQDSLSDLARNAGFYGVLFAVGLAIIHAIAFLLAFLAWNRRPRPREIRATITADGLTMKKDGYSYAAHWRDADLVTETRAAFLLKFNQLYMRLPKRGFTAETAAAFRVLAAAAQRNF